MVTTRATKKMNCKVTKLIVPNEQQSLGGRKREREVDGRAGVKKQSNKGKMREGRALITGIYIMQGAYPVLQSS
jgi:hypothetical protein